MAALFGLSEFSGFVQDFTKNFDERYLSIKSSTEESFREQQAVRDGKNNELSEQEKGLKQIKDEIKKAIDGLAKEHDEIKTIQQAIDFYDDAESGILTKKIQRKDAETVKPIEKENFNSIKNNCNEIINCLNLII